MCFSLANICGGWRVINEMDTSYDENTSNGQTTDGQTTDVSDRREHILLIFKVCKSVHHHTIQINQPTKCNNFSSLLLDIYLQLSMFRASSRPLSGAQQLQ